MKFYEARWKWLIADKRRKIRSRWLGHMKMRRVMRCVKNWLKQKLKNLLEVGWRKTSGNDQTCMSSIALNRKKCRSKIDKL